MDSEQRGTSQYFNEVIGYIEDIVIGEEFQTIQRNIMEKYYQDFDAAEENKISYTGVFEVYTNTLEKFIEEQLNKRMKGSFEMDVFVGELMNMRHLLDGEIFELLFSLTDFTTFKDLVLDYKAYKQGEVEDIAGAGITITKLSNQSSDDENVAME